MEGGRFYYGVSRYLNGNATDGIRLMNKAAGDLPVNMRKRPVDSLKNERIGELKNCLQPRSNSII